MAARTVIPVHSGWAFKAADEDDSHWLPVAQFPTNIHLDLLAHQKIPDPFIGKNESLVQWVGERKWMYRTRFVLPEAARTAGKTVLSFEGLDTFATVALNGKTILESDNMFLPHRVDVLDAVAPDGATNELVITFDSAYLRGWKRVEQHPDHKWGCWNGDNSRLAVRKAQYHWGWDWGPTLLTCGPWRPVYLETYDARIADLSFRTDVDESLKVAKVMAEAEVEMPERAPAFVRFDIFLGDASVASETVIVHDTPSTAYATFRINRPALWYPRRYGKQPLYTVKATLLLQPESAEEPQEVDVVTKKIGLRLAELVQRPLKEQPGTSFFFRINNIPIFCGGSNWIPADNFVPRISPQRYHDWVKLVADGHQCMIRVWGGGLYEEQEFYDACDELGILVWQDFMFGCGNYPVWPEFRESIRLEAEANVRLLRHHPSIVIWAGNNEDYQYQESEGLTYDYANKNAQSWLKTDFPARYIYEKILADVCAELIPGTYYHYGSPWGGGVDTHDPTVGDIHQWNVWHGTQEKYQDFDKLVGRFVSEFGMEAFPHVRTIDAFLPEGRDDADRYAQSSTVDFHNKAAGHERRLALYLVENIRYGPDPLEEFVYSTQLMQAECLASAYRLWKRQWKGPGQEYCGGAMVWQINDCWPVTSWSICDYYLRPKHAYYAIKREMAPISIGMRRREHSYTRDRHSRVETGRETKLEIWACNLTLEDVTVDCVVRAWDVGSGECTYDKVVSSCMTLGKNQSTELAELDVPVRTAGHETRTVVAAYLMRTGGEEQLARSVNWPEPLKYVHLAQPKQLQVRLTESGNSVAVSAEVPVKGVAVEVVEVPGEEGKEGEAVEFADNLVDVVPGETVYLGVRGVTGMSRFQTRYLGQGGVGIGELGF